MSCLDMSAHGAASHLIMLRGRDGLKTQRKKNPREWISLKWVNLKAKPPVSGNLYDVTTQCRVM